MAQKATAQRPRLRPRTREEIEALVDEMGDESFPASDPPAWNTLAQRPKLIYRRQMSEQATVSPIYDFQVKTIDGKATTLKEYKGKVLLIVNVASKCGFTSQYEGLEKLHKKYHGQGFSVLGFPCNQFGNQEPGNEEEIKKFCELKYHVTFPMFYKIDVNGPKTHPLYQYLKKEKKGFMGTEAIKWNFTKFLIHRDGLQMERFSPQTEPAAIEKEIEAALKG